MSEILVVMAAGMGSRYGEGVKQLAEIGPCGESLMEYSVHDAVEAGFDHIVFVIREEIRDLFLRTAGGRILKECARRGIRTDLAYQRLDDLPDGFDVPPFRVKPWGTGAAVLACRDLLTDPFCVINADDYYGRTAFRKMHARLAASRLRVPRGGVYELCMAGFVLGNTLSSSGAVTRGICTTKRGWLKRIDETKHIVKTPAGPAVEEHAKGGRKVILPLDPDAVVSMNMWGMTPDFVGELTDGFRRFLDGAGKTDPDAEFLLPVLIGELLREGRARVKVLPTSDVWVGLTYQQDAPAARTAFDRMTARGMYQRNLFSDWNVQTA